MQLTQGSAVVASGGKKVGRLDRVVLDPRTREVVAIVVQKGGELSEDKVVPVGLVEAGESDEIRLRGDAESLSALPAFEEKHYVVVNERQLLRELEGPKAPPPMYWYPPFGGVVAPLPDPVAPAASVVLQTEVNIPPDTVALRPGAKVMDRDGDTVGKLEKVLTEPQADRATHLVITHGLLMKERRVIPTTWVDSVGEDWLRLTVGASQLEALRRYED